MLYNKKQSKVNVNGPRSIKRLVQCVYISDIYLINKEIMVVLLSQSSMWPSL